MVSNKNFYVYALLDPRKPGPFRYGRWRFEYEPFYIGKGTGQRYLAHIRRISPKNLPKDNKIRKILASGFEVISTIKVCNLDESDAFDLERRLIRTIGRLGSGGPLTNLTDGGEGLSNPSSKTRKRIAKAVQKRYAIMPEPEFARLKQRISNATRAGHATRSQESRRAQCKNLSESTRLFWSSVPDSVRLERGRRLTAARESMSEADRQILSRTASEHMRRVNAAIAANPKKKMALYAKVSAKLCQPVCIDGIMYGSSKEASAALGLNKNTISRRLRSDEFPNYFKV